MTMFPKFHLSPSRSIVADGPSSPIENPIRFVTQPLIAQNDGALFDAAAAAYILSPSLTFVFIRLGQSRHLSLQETRERY